MTTEASINSWNTGTKAWWCCHLLSSVKLSGIKMCFCGCEIRFHPDSTRPNENAGLNILKYEDSDPICQTTSKGGPGCIKTFNTCKCEYISNHKQGSSNSWTQERGGGSRWWWTVHTIAWPHKQLPSDVWMKPYEGALWAFFSVCANNKFQLHSMQERWHLVAHWQYFIQGWHWSISQNTLHFQY